MQWGRSPMREGMLRRHPQMRGAIGVVVALTAGVGFSTGGVIAKPLFDEGWTPPAAVLARIALAVVVLAPFALRSLSGRWSLVWKGRWTLLAYGVLAVVGTQVGFYSALERIPVSTALLIQYLAPVALLLFVWVRSRRTPHRTVLIGAVLALGGFVVVIGPTNSTFLDPLGIVFAIVAMVGLAVYYAIGERPNDGISPIAFVWLGLLVGGSVIALSGWVGALPVHMTFESVDFFGGRAPWWAPVLFIGLFSTAYAYAAGIWAITLLGARVSSFLGLTEVVFAAAAGWLLLGESISAPAFIGAGLILAGIILVRLDPSATPAVVQLEALTSSEPLPAERSSLHTRPDA